MSARVRGLAAASPADISLAVALPLAVLLALPACSGATYSLGTDCIPSGTERELQAAIDSREQVLLCQGAVMTLNAPIVLRQGRTLETIHRPTTPAEMATLVLGPLFPGVRSPVVGSGSDIQIAHVRIDGNRRVLGPQDPIELVRLGPGNRYTVTGNLLTDTSGWTHLHVVEPCVEARITGNTVESAVRPHDAAGHNADGLSISCADSLIEGNSINDISGVGIVYYGGPNTIIRNNTIIEATTSAYSGINVGDAVRIDHTGVIVEQNTVRAIGNSYFHLGISAGLHAWRNRNISGLTVRRNTISGLIRYGLAVDGCLACVVIDNQITDWRPLAPIAGCPAPAAYIASVANGHAGGTLQPGYTNATIDGCLGAPLPP